MTNQSPSSTNSFARSHVALTAFTVVLLLAGWSIFVWFGVKPFLTPSQSVTQPAPKPEEPSTVVPQPTPTTSTIPKLTYAEAERKMLLDLQHRELGGRLKPLQARWQEIQNRYTVWTQRMKELRASDEGRRLASTTLARQVQLLELTVGQLTLVEIERQLSEMQRTLDGIENPIPKLSDWDLRLSTLDTQLAISDSTIQQCDAVMSQLLAGAAQPQSQTLQQAIVSLSETDQRAVREAVKLRVDTLRKNHEAELDSARQRHQVLKTESAKSSAVRTKVEAETRLEIQAARANAERQLEVLGSKKVEARKALEAGYPAVRTLLTAFTGSGYKQLDASSTYVTTTETKPVSYAALLRSGALEDDAKGLAMLFDLGQCKVQYRDSNDRDRGTFPERQSEFDIKKPAIIATLKQAQAFLRTHGEAMVEAKLLSP